LAPKFLIEAELIRKYGLMKILKRILKWISYLVGIYLIVVAAFIGWSMYREPIAKQEAQDFCATIRVGQSIDGIRERAISSGAYENWAKWKTLSDSTRTMSVMYIGTPPFSRHSCVIRATDVVVSAEYFHMD
jgi:hypothetical protein